MKVHEWSFWCAAVRCDTMALTPTYEASTNTHRTWRIVALVNLSFKVWKASSAAAVHRKGTGVDVGRYREDTTELYLWMNRR